MGEIGRSAAPTSLRGIGLWPMGQGLGFVGEQQPDVAGPGLLPQQVATQTGARDRLGVLAAGQGMTWPAPGEAPFWRSRMLSREGEMATSDRRRISALSRGKVQTVRPASARIALAQAKAASPRPPGRPVWGRDRSASTPPARNRRRHWRTRSARTPSARPIVGPSWPASVHKIARARSASPRASDRDRTTSAAHCAAVATNPERAMFHHHFNSPRYHLDM